MPSGLCLQPQGSAIGAKNLRLGSQVHSLGLPLPTTFSGAKPVQLTAGWRAEPKSAGPRSLPLKPNTKTERVPAERKFQHVTAGRLQTARLCGSQWQGGPPWMTSGETGSVAAHGSQSKCSQITAINPSARAETRGSGTGFKVGSEGRFHPEPRFDSEMRQSFGPQANLDSGMGISGSQPFRDSKVDSVAGPDLDQNLSPTSQVWQRREKSPSQLYNDKREKQWGLGFRPKQLDGSKESATASQQLRILWRINDSTKWVVSLAAAVTLLLRHDEFMAWCVVGAVLNGANAKLLKRALNQDRPETARETKRDPGMPSSHGQSLGFLSTYAALTVAQGYGWSAAAIAGSGLIFALGGFLAWLRVITGLHTREQVLVGGVLGAISAVGWLWAWDYIVHPAIQSEGSWGIVHTILGFGCILAVCAFIAQVIKKWFDGK